MTTSARKERVKDGGKEGNKGGREGGREGGRDYLKDFTHPLRLSPLGGAADPHADFIVAAPRG